jgi:hypothetical protein
MKLLTFLTLFTETQHPTTQKAEVKTTSKPVEKETPKPFGTTSNLFFVKTICSSNNSLLEKPVSPVTKSAPATSRNVQLKDCHNTSVKEVDDQTLQGIIIVEDCPCEARFTNNAARINAVSTEVTTQLNSYMKQTHGNTVNYKCAVQLVTGNATNTVFHYTCTVPKADHANALVGMLQSCTNPQVIFSFIS